MLVLFLYRGGNMTKKNSNYTFRCNEELKEKFKMLCKIGKVSPSDVLENVMQEFCDMAEKVMEMDDVSQLRDMFQEKVTYASNELQKVEEHPTFHE